MKTERKKRGASATHARTTIKETPRRRALLAGLFANGLVQAAGAGLLAIAEGTVKARPVMVDVERIESTTP